MACVWCDELDDPRPGIELLLPLFDGLVGFVEFTDDDELPECRLSASTPPTMPRLELEMESLVESRNGNSVGRCWCVAEPTIVDDAGTLMPLPTLPARSELTELVSPPVDIVICNNVNL